MSALEKINGILSGVDFSVFERAKALLAKPIDGDFSEFVPDSSAQESQPVVSKRPTHRPPKKPVPKLLTDINDSLEMDESYGAIAAAVAPLDEMHSQLMQKKRTSSKKGDIHLQSPTNVSPSAKGTPFSAKEERSMSIHHGHDSVQSSSPSRHSRNVLDSQTQFQKETQERLRKAIEEKRQKQEQIEYDEYLDKKMKSRDEEERLERFRKETMKRLAQRKAELAHKQVGEEERKREEELAHKMAEQEAVERAQRATKDRLKNYRKVEPVTQERGRHEVSQTDSHFGSDRSTSPTPEEAERLERFRRETVKRLAERVSKLREENEQQKRLERERLEEAERRREAEAEIAERARKEAAKRLSEFKKQCARQAQIEEEQRRREEEELVRKMKKKSAPLAQQTTHTTVTTDGLQSSNGTNGDVYTPAYSTRNERFEKSNFVKQDRVVPKTKTLIGSSRSTISANGSLASATRQVDSYVTSDAELIVDQVSSPEDDHASLSSIDSLDRDDLMSSDQRKPPPAREIQSIQKSAHHGVDEVNEIDLNDFDTEYTDAFDDAYADPFLNLVQPKFNISSEDFTSKTSKSSDNRNNGKRNNQSKKTFARPPKPVQSNPVQPSSSLTPSLVQPKVEAIRKVDTSSPKPVSTPNRFVFDSLPVCPPTSSTSVPVSASPSGSGSASASVSSQNSFYKANQPQPVSFMNHLPPKHQQQQKQKQKQKHQPSKDTFVWEEEDDSDNVNSDLENDFDQMLSREISQLSKHQPYSRAPPPAPAPSKPFKPVQNMSKVIREEEEEEEDESEEEEKWNGNISTAKRHVENKQQRNGHSTVTGSKLVQPKSYKETNKKQMPVVFSRSSSSPSTTSLRSPSVRSVRDDDNGTAGRYGESKIDSTPTSTTTISSRNVVKKDVTPVWKRAPVPVHSTEYYMTQDKYKYTQQQLKKQQQQQHLPPFSNNTSNNSNNSSTGVTHHNGYSRRPQLDSRVSAISDQPRSKHSIPPHLQLTVQRNVSSAPSPAPASVPVYATVDSPHSVDHLILNHHSSQHSIKPFIPPLEFVGRSSPDDTSSIASSSRFSAQQQPGSTYGQIHGKQSKSHPSQFFSEYTTASSVRSNTPPLRDISRDVRKRAFAVEEEEKERQRSKESQVLSAVHHRTNMKARPVSYARVRR